MMDAQTAAQRPTRREREAARHRAEILEAAEAVFAESGFETARMDVIARRAEFSVGTLYRFFESKEHLYGELLSEKITHMDQTIQAALSEGSSPLDKIRRVFYVRIELFWRNRMFFSLLVRETTGTLCNPRGRWAPYVMEPYNRFMEQLRAIFEDGVAQGEFKDLGADVLVLSFEGIMRAYFAHLGQQPSDSARNSDEEERILAAFTNGALNNA